MVVVRDFRSKNGFRNVSDVTAGHIHTRGACVNRNDDDGNGAEEGKRRERKNAIIEVAISSRCHLITLSTHTPPLSFTFTALAKRTEAKMVENRAN